MLTFPTSVFSNPSLVDLADMPLVRHAHEPFLSRVWQLKDNITAYDAVYIALAEGLQAPLVTCDGRLARAPVPGVEIELITR